MTDYKRDIREVPLHGIDAGIFIAALYNNALTGGMGIVTYNGDQMAPAEGKHLFTHLKALWQSEVKARATDTKPGHTRTLGDERLKKHFDMNRFDPISMG